MSLIGHGRKAEAGDFLTQSARLGDVTETLVAAEVLRVVQRQVGLGDQLLGIGWK